MPLAVSLEQALYGGFLFLILLLVPATVTLLKGQRALFVIGLLFFGAVWTVAAFRLARPDSWWAHRFYDDHKLARARRRYG